MPTTESQNRNEVKEIKFHHRVKRFYHKNLFRKIYTVAIIGLIGANVFSMVKYSSFADESLVDTPVQTQGGVVSLSPVVGEDDEINLEIDNEVLDENLEIGDEIPVAPELDEDVVEHSVADANDLGLYTPSYGDTLEVADVDHTKDIVIQVTAVAGQSILMSKYFYNNYTVDWGDGNIENIIGGCDNSLHHRYNVGGIYNITLSLLGGETRRTFGGGASNALVQIHNTSVTNVKIIRMPSLADGFGESATAPGRNFFKNFNSRGAITELPEGSFDTSNIEMVEWDFFRDFNVYGQLKNLPEGSFRLDNIMEVGDYFFSRFNEHSQISELPEGSFKIDNITEAGDYFFYAFNIGGDLINLPEGSFRTDNITEVGDYFFSAFNDNGSLTSLPEGSFRTDNIIEVGDYFFSSFNYNGLLTSLPEGSFDTSNISELRSSSFNYFNYGGNILCPDGYGLVNGRCREDSAIIHKDGYIKITDGEKIIYIKDRNQGATKITSSFVRDSDYNYFNDEYYRASLGKYYFWGNNVGASLEDLGIDGNINYYYGDLYSPSYNKTIAAGFDGGKMGDGETGWEEWSNIENPCNSEDGEYLPTISDWEDVIYMWNDIRLENMENGIDGDFMIPNAGIITNIVLDGDYVSYDLGEKLRIAMNDEGNVGYFDGNNPYYWNSDSYDSYNDIAMPVRCFIKPEYIEEGNWYTVTFMDGDEELFTKEIKGGKPIKNVEDPTSTEEGYGFAGWYRDPELTKEFDMTESITDNITLYAKWAPKGVFHKDGYIKVTNGKDTIYVSDKNVGATVSQGLPIREDVNMKGDELFEKYGDSEEFENAIMAYAREKGIDFYFVDDLFNYLNPLNSVNNPLVWEIQEYYGQKMLELFDSYINGEDLTEDEQQDLLKGMNKLYKRNFDTLDECYEYFESLGMDVASDEFELYVINSVANKDFEDLDEAWDYVYSYNQYNPEYGEVDVNSFGDYYYRGNNNGVKYENLDIDYKNGEIKNMDELNPSFLELSDFDNEGWKREGKDNPCNGENEYLPSPEDWYDLMEIWGELNDATLSDYSTTQTDSEDINHILYSYYFDDYSKRMKFQNDMLIPSAGDIYMGDDGRVYHENGFLYLKSSLDNDYISELNGNSLYFSHKNLRKSGQEHDFASSVRCFLNEEPEDEDDTPTTPVTPEPTTPSTPVNNYSGGGRKKAESVTNMHNSADEKDSTQNDAKGSENTKTPTNSSSNASEGQTQNLDMKQYNATYTPEQNTAYQFAKSHGITTTSSIRDAKMNTPLTRIQMAKMLSQYAMNVLGKTPDHSAGIINFKDVTNKLNTEYDNGVTLAYQLGIMGINMSNNEFRPYDKVTRAEFATALSRMLYDMEDGKGRIKYYEPHMARLYNEGIINNTNPKMEELRGYVMTMLMRTVE